MSVIWCEIKLQVTYQMFILLHMYVKIFIA